MLQEANGAKIRAGLKYAELDEKCNRYFLALEKNRAIDNTIYKLKVDNSELTECDDILSSIMIYYENIYKNECLDNSDEMKKCDELFLKETNVNHLNIAEKDSMDYIVTLGEILSTVKVMKNGSSPGLDGIPIEFYKFFLD